MPRFLVVLLVAAFTACAQVSYERYDPDEYHVRPGEQLVQGMIGIMDISGDPLEVESQFGSVASQGATSLPVFGAAVQLPQVGDRVQLGVEAGLTAGFEDDRAVVASSNGGALLVSDNDVLLVDAFAGVVGNVFVTPRLRIYAAGGPVLQYGRVDLEYVEVDSSLVSIGDSGFGLGVYARVGLEIEIGPGRFAGFGARWIDSRVDLGGGLQDYDFEALQIVFSMTTGF